MTTELRESITATLRYMETYSIPIPADILIEARRKGITVKAVGDYSSIRDRLYDAIYNAVSGFLSSNAQIGTYSRPMMTALSQAYIDTADVGYTDGGGSLPLDEDTAAWARAELQAQFGFVDSLFQTLKALRKEGDFDTTAEATTRAGGYSQSLDMLYSGAKLRAAGNMMLTFAGEDGLESCKDCSRYKGQRHRASWWVAHGAIPPSRDFECKGYNCLHMLVDDNGNEFTI